MRRYSHPLLEFAIHSAEQDVALESIQAHLERMFSVRVDFTRLENMDNDKIIENLTKLSGNGRWTVECFLLFGLGRADLLPAADIGLRNAVKKQYGLPEQPEEQKVRKIGEAWSPWRSYATFYMWESLNEQIILTKLNCGAYIFN